MNEDSDAIERLAYRLVCGRSDLHTALVSLRILKGISQAEVAERIAVAPEAVAHFERYDGMDYATMAFVDRYALAIGAMIERKVTDDDRVRVRH